MSQHKTAVGVFTLIGLILFVCGLFFLGGRDLFKTKTEYVLYFEGSVSGLSVGAPVYFRGVPLGSVKRISLVFDPKSSAITIPVYINIDESSIVKHSGEQIPEVYQKRIIKHMVDKGLSARLQVQNFVTGQYRIELDYHSTNDLETAESRQRALNEIPTVPSELDSLQQKFNNIPLEDMANALNSVLLGLSNAVGDGSELKDTILTMKQTFSDVNRSFKAMTEILEDPGWRHSSGKILANMEQSSTDLATAVPALMKELSGIMANITEATAVLKRSSLFAGQLLTPNSPLVQDLRRVVREAAEAARSLHTFADMLNRNPEALLQGKRGGR
ncbi:MAG: MlaD family protein [Desulfovibrio sp.]|nr:MlaD family protein [Desulfovibrio sp.]